MTIARPTDTKTQDAEGREIYVDTAGVQWSKTGETNWVDDAGQLWFAESWTHANGDGVTDTSQTAIEG